MIRVVRVVAAFAAFLRLFAFAFLLPIPVSFAFDPYDADIYGVQVPAPAIIFLLCATGTWLGAWIIGRIARGGAEGLADREGYLTVAVGALALPAVAMAPFLGVGATQDTLGAYVQAMSDLTTTGLRFLDLGGESLVAPSLYFWRACMQWLGGIGIVVLGIVLLSNLSGSPVQLFQAENNATAQRLRPRLAATARVVIGLYVGLTLVAATALGLLLLRDGFDARGAFLEGLMHAMGAVSTGGISAHPDNVAHFADPLVEGLLVILMLLGASHINILVALRQRKFRAVATDPEWRFFLGLLAVIALVVGVTLAVHGFGVLEAVRGGIFWVVSLGTGTGYWNVDAAVWPVAALFPLLVLLLIGGSSGSPAGALKSFRLLLGAKVLGRQLRLLVHPRAVLPLRFGERTVKETALATATAFLYTYLLAWALGTLAVAILEPGMSALEAAGASAAAIGNVALAFGPLGPGGSAADLAPATQVVMAALMWLGRLEIFAALLVFYPSSWRH